MRYLLVCSLAFVAPLPAIAADGDLDTSFGSGGKVRLPQAGGQDTNLDQDAQRIDNAIRAGKIGTFTVIGRDIVGPTVGKDLQWKGISATLAALGGILIYVGLRFRFTFAVGAIVATLPNRVSISGHTSGNDAPGGASWDLSSNRANQARAMLQVGGLGTDRIYEVAGKAGSEPLLPEDPNASANRRLSILLMREAPPVPAHTGLN